MLVEHAIALGTTEDGHATRLACHRFWRLTGRVIEISPIQRGILAGGHRLGLDGIEEMAAKLGCFGLSL